MMIMEDEEFEKMLNDFFPDGEIEQNLNISMKVEIDIVPIEIPRSRTKIGF